jgi:hypothetical protein
MVGKGGVLDSLAFCRLAPDRSFAQNTSLNRNNFSLISNFNFEAQKIMGWSLTAVVCGFLFCSIRPLDFNFEFKSSAKAKFNDFLKCRNTSFF